MDELKKLIEAALYEPPKAEVVDVSQLVAAALNDEPVELLDPIKAEFNKFIQASGIRSGTKAIALAMVYDKYLKWAKRPIGKQTFYKYFRELFTVKKSANIFFAHLDPTSLGLVPTYSLYRDPNYFGKYNRGYHKNKRRKQKQHKKQVEAVSGQTEDPKEP